MEILFSSLLFVFGLVILVYSSNWLIQVSVKLSHIFKLTPLFIGMIVVAFGTSSPEAGVGIMAAIRNQRGIALGNIIGSNIANIALVLGLCAFIRPLKVDKRLFKRELPILLLSVGLFFFLSADLLISRFDGLLLILTFLVFCLISYKGAKGKFDSKEIENFKLKPKVDNLNSRAKVLSLVLLSLVGVVFGADLMVRGGVSLARTFGVSTWVIGITVFAIGTSLPELVTSLTASIKKVSSIGVGNIIGSNIFNLLLVLGIVALINPIDLKLSLLLREIPLLLGFSLGLFLIMRRNYRIGRGEGLVMFLGYLTFLFIILKK